MDTNVVAVRPRQTLIHAADNHGVAQIGPPQPKFSPRITRMNAKKNFGSKSREPASPRKLSGLQRNPQYPCNRADGISEIEGKAARAAASELGSERVSTPWFSPLCFVSIRVHSWLTLFGKRRRRPPAFARYSEGLREHYGRNSLHCVRICPRITLIDANQRRELCPNDPNLGGC